MSEQRPENIAAIEDAARGDDALEHTLRVWEPIAGRPVTQEEARQIRENVVGHYALIGHSDTTYGLEREISNEGEELIVFGGVARTVAPPTLLLDEDDETLLFDVSKGEVAAAKLFTPAEAKIWEAAQKLHEFTHADLLARSKTTNRKAITSTLRKAETAGLLQHKGRIYSHVRASLFEVAA